MRKTSIALTLLILLAPISGCVSDDSNPDDSQEQEISELGDWNVFYVESVSELPPCESSTDGRLYYISSTSGFEACSKGEWGSINLIGPAGDSGADGAQGPAGADGAQGPAGADGKKSLIMTSEELPGDNCPNGGTRIEVGVDENDDSALQDTEIEQTGHVCNSAPIGTLQLSSYYELEGSPECSAGETIIYQGIDTGDEAGGNPNGQLDNSEITEQISYCNNFYSENLHPFEGDSFENQFSRGWEPALVTESGIFFSGGYRYCLESNCGVGIWKTDGTAGGTEPVASFHYSDFGDSANEIWFSLPKHLTQLGSEIYFTIRMADFSNGDPDDARAIGQLWKIDEASFSLTLVKEIWNYSWSDSSYESLQENNCLTVAGDNLFFMSEDQESGLEIWKTDGTLEGTHMIKDINPGSADSIYASSDSCWGSSGSEIFFEANGGDGRGLWKSDGTSEGTIEIGSFSLAENFEAMGENLFFSGFDENNGGWALWKTDGTESGTEMVKDPNANISWGGPIWLTAVGSTLFFVLDDGTGDSLWKSDGTSGGTVIVKDVNQNNTCWGGPQYPNIFSLTPAGEELFFIGNDGIHGLELWKSDGTESGTSMVKAINTKWTCMPWSDPHTFFPTGFGLGYESQRPSMHFMEGMLYFNPTFEGQELWVSDGTESGTMMLDDVNPGADVIWDSESSSNYVVEYDSAFVTDIISYNGSVFFSAYYDGLGNWEEVYRDRFLYKYGSIDTEVTVTQF